jgi:oligopeptide/dipeptide ABC transporter ATP-binding protein
MLEGDPPSLRSVPSGCRFHPRCPIAQPRCTTEEPSFDSISESQRVACHYWQDGISENQEPEGQAHATL